MVVYKAEDDIKATGVGMRPEIKDLRDIVTGRPMTASNDKNIASGAGKLSLVSFIQVGNPPTKSALQQPVPMVVDASISLVTGKTIDQDFKNQLPRE